MTVCIYRYIYTLQLCVIDLTQRGWHTVRAHYLSVSWARLIQSTTPSHHICLRRILNVIFSMFSWVFQAVLFPQISPPKPRIRLSTTPHTCHMPYPYHSSLFVCPNNIWWVQNEQLRFKTTWCTLAGMVYLWENLRKLISWTRYSCWVLSTLFSLE